MERLRDMPIERIHSRKLRSFEETAFLTDKGPPNPVNLS